MFCFWQVCTSTVDSLTCHLNESIILMHSMSIVRSGTHCLLHKVAFGILIRSITIAWVLSCRLFGVFQQRLCCHHRHACNQSSPSWLSIYCMCCVSRYNENTHQATRWGTPSTIHIMMLLLEYGSQFRVVVVYDLPLWNYIRNFISKNLALVLKDLSTIIYIF